MRSKKSSKKRQLIIGLAALVCGFGAIGSSASGKQWRFDCGTRSSPVMAGYERLTEADLYNAARGYGWEEPRGKAVRFQNPGPLRPHSLPREEVFEENLTGLNCDAVVSQDPLVFRIDVPEGAYRISLLIGDMSQAIGSIDVSINDEEVASQVSAWTPGGYRKFARGDWYGWWTHVRHTAQAKDGAIRVRLSKNQSYYDEQMAEQWKWSNPYRVWWSHAKEKDPPYYFIGLPFVGNSLMAIEILPAAPPAVIGENKSDTLDLITEVRSPALEEAISKYNGKEFDEAVRAVARVREPEAQVAKAIVMLWLAGRPEVEMDQQLVPAALSILRSYAAEHSEETGVQEVLQDAEYFAKALQIHLERGAIGTRNHFIENDKALGWWWLIGERSPLYYKSQLYIARVAHMLVPYQPTLGTAAEILKNLEKKFPDNRFVKYLLHWTWEPHGDGTHFYDWRMNDYDDLLKGAPKWVRSL